MLLKINLGKVGCTLGFEAVPGKKANHWADFEFQVTIDLEFLLYATGIWVSR